MSQGDRELANQDPEARLALVAEPPAEPTARELADIKEMSRFLCRQRANGKRKTPEPPDELLNGELVKKLWSSMSRLLGTTILRHHRACGIETKHNRGRICALCGYSDNLYLQELERLLRRHVRKAADDKK